MQNQRGNALFLILIAVALFAALSYAVTQSSRGGGSGVDAERNELAAARIVEYPAMVKIAIDRMRISNGCSDTQISFENSFVSGYTNAGAPADKSCHVFDPNGGGMNWVDPDPAWQGTIGAFSLLFSGNACIPDIGTGGAGCGQASEKELILAYTNITKDLCLLINDKLGITNPGGNPPDDADAFGIPKFTGAYVSAAGQIINSSSNVPEGCVDYLSLGAYVYYKTLIAR